MAKKKKAPQPYVVEKEEQVHIAHGEHCYWIGNGTPQVTICVQGTPHRAKALADRIAFLLN